MNVLLSVIILLAVLDCTDAPTWMIIDEKYLFISLIPELRITECMSNYIGYHHILRF